MSALQYLSPKPLPALGAALLVAAAGAVQAQTAAPAAEAALVESMKRLATEDRVVQKQRWGDLAAAAGRGWLHRVPGDVGNVWRDIHWLVPGALMRYHRGLCIAIRCQGTDYLVHYDERTGGLVFLDQGAPALSGRVQDDGSVRVSGNSLVGLLSGETLRLDAAAQTLFSDSHDLRPASGAQLAEATRGLAGEATAPAGTGVAAAASVPAASASAAADAAQLRAELAAVKAQMEALNRQLQAQQQGAPSTAAAPALSPASAAAEARRAQASSAAARAAELRAEREAQAQAAQERKLATERQAREEASRRAEAAAQARQEAQARAEEARRLAQEQRARDEQARREAAEANAREAQARAAEARRLAEEQRAAQEAARSAAAMPVAGVPFQPTAPAAPAAPATRTNACGGVDGLYGIVASNYRIEVKFAQDSLAVVEPNRTSTYKHLGQCQYGFTHPTGIEYRLGVVPRGLVAYKPGQSEAQKTQLALLQAAAPQSAGSCKAQEIPVENPQALHPGLARLYGAHVIAGVTLPGRYQAPEPDGHPRTVLGERGEGGEFEVYGAPKPQYVYRILRWYIQANCDGTLVEEDHPVAKRYYLIYQLDRPYGGLAWQRAQFIVRKNEDRVSIDDRSKRRN